jgi:hypothetical protein
VLLSRATDLENASKEIIKALDKTTIKNIINTIPEDWLINEGDSLTPSEIRDAYTDYLDAKLAMIDSLVKEAQDAR